MDQITVSDIPLPGEEFSLKTDNPLPTTGDASNADLKTEEVKSIEEEQPVQDLTEAPSKTEAAENIEVNNQPAEITSVSIEPATEIQEILSESTTETSEIEINEADESELKLSITIESETEIQELVQDDVNEVHVAESETVTVTVQDQDQEVECVTGDVIAETVEELQMEVERAASEQAEINKTQIQQTEREPEQVVEEEVAQPTELDLTQPEPVEDIRLDIIKEDTVSVVEEPPTPAIEEEIVEENYKIEKPESPKPAKKITRTNSTIEAIKNDWADSLTIEEINEEEEEQMNEASSKLDPESAKREPESVPIITEPDNKKDEHGTDAGGKCDIVEEKLETVEEKLETVEEKLETIVEATEESQTTENVTEVIVLETVNEEFVTTVAENVTIEIIDNRQQQLPFKDEQQLPVKDDQQLTDNDKTDDKLQPDVVKEEEETVYIVEEVANNNTNTTTDDNVVEIVEEKNGKPKRNAGGRPSRASQRLCAKDDKLQIPCHVLGRNVDNPTEDLISNGRTPPKPRLGVKVPYRFLTSQIVSKEEIADELIELTNKRNPAPDPPAGGDIFFASKLTQRLASKIASNANKKQKLPEDNKTEEKETVEATSGIPTEAFNTSATPSTTTGTIASGSQTNKNTIGDNSDLLAILEGDVDVDWTKEVGSTKQATVKPTEAKTNDVVVEVLTETKVLNVQQQKRKSKSPDVMFMSAGGISGRRLDPETERLLALKQLREMPMKKEGRGRPRKHHHLYDSKSYQKQYIQELTKKREAAEAAAAAAAIKKNPESPAKVVKKEAVSPAKVVKKEAVSPASATVVHSPTKLQQVSNETNENIKQAVTKLAMKIKENEVIIIHDDSNKSVEMENELNLNPKRVTKTYSRKEAVLDVPAELEYIVNEPETPSIISDQPEDKKQENTTGQQQNKNVATAVVKQKTTIQAKQQQQSPAKKTKRSAVDINKPEVTLVSKRARIIKKKVIWDPAEVPKTKVLNAIRKAQVLEMKARKKQKKSVEEDDEEEDEESSEEEEEESIKETPKQEVKNKQPDLQQRQLRKHKILPRPVLTKVQKKKLFMKRQLRSLKGKLVRSSNGELKPNVTLRQKKKQQQVMSNKPKKTELDRLLGDEGAVNMLYSVRQNKIRGKISQKTVVTKKELLNRKKVIKDVITQSSTKEDTPKALRKKESPALPAIQIPPRKKSRDSVRSSLQSPPPSPSYFHPKGAEASRIIRRHSSSFSSDCSSPRRLSVDQPQQINNKQEATDENGDFQSPVRVLRRKNVQPEQKSEEKQLKSKKDETKTEKEKLSVAEKRKLNVEMSKNFDKTPKKRTRSSKGEDEDVKEETKPEVKNKTPKKAEKDEQERFINVQTEYKEILLKKSNNFYQIVMNSPANAKLKNVISLQMFHELGAVLTKLSKDDSCKVVVLTSTGKSFCRGLDFSNLIQTTAEKRSTAAQEMSKSLKEFILTLAKFPKPLLASLHSSTSLLGCTMLPYFDVVVCAEAATLSADYSRVGHCPEGAPGQALCPRVGPAIATDMLMLGRRLTAKEAMDNGLVTRVEKPEKMEEVLWKITGELCEKSPQCLAATKSLLRQPLLAKLGEALEFEGALLVEHWVTPECQQNFKKLLQEEELW